MLIYFCGTTYFFTTILTMSRQTTKYKDIYNQKIHSLFAQVICETESLYERVTRQIKQDSQSTTIYFSK